MALKVMLSSVRRGGLGPIRDAIAPFLDVGGYVPIRFESETAQPVPPRAVCVGMVKRCDIYVLLLGAEYGESMPDSDLAPTAEEWTVARNEGKPIIVFRQTDIEPDPRQAQFIEEVEAYSTGVFRRAFRDTADLLGQLKSALAEAAALIQPMRPRELTGPIEVIWRQDERNFRSGQLPALETHVIPIGPVPRLRASGFQEVARSLARTGRDHGLFGEGDALSLATSEQGVVAETEARGGATTAGIAISTERIVTAWTGLPTEQVGAVYRESQVAAEISRHVRLAAAIGLIESDEVAVAVGINRIDSIFEPTGPTSGTFPFMSAGTRSARVEAAEAYPSASLTRIAPELGSELAARLTLRMRRR